MPGKQNDPLCVLKPSQLRLQVDLQMFIKAELLIKTATRKSAGTDEGYPNDTLSSANTVVHVSSSYIHAPHYDVSLSPCATTLD